MTEPMIEQLQAAWMAAVDEFIAINPDGPKSMLSNLVTVIKKIRDTQLIIEAKNELFVRHIYGDIRNIQDLHILVMSMTTTFMSELAEPVAALDYFCYRAMPYTEKSNVVDNNTLSRKAPVGALGAILADNPWLFMLCFASTQERLTVTRLAGIKGPTK